MNNDFNYKNFYELLSLKNSKNKENLLKNLIDAYLCQHFLVDERRWFNQLCNHGLINLVYHCEQTIPEFSLFDNSQSPNSFSNVSFLWAIESGNFELIKYFTQHKDFYKFCKNKDIEKDIASFIELYRERSKKFSLKNYEKIVDFLVEKFPLSIPEIFEKAILNHNNEEITSFLKSFFIKYNSYLKNHLSQNKNDNLTRYCMISLVKNCFDFADFLKNQCPDMRLKKERLEMILYYTNRDTTVIDWILKRPQFFHLQKENFNDLFKRIFQNPIQNKIKKEDYNFFFYINKIGLNNLTKKQMQESINSNLIILVKKYYNQFINHDLNLIAGNTCTQFIQKKNKEKLYKNLLNKFPVKKISDKKIKI